jgi:hypothetical protein
MHTGVIERRRRESSRDRLTELALAQRAAQQIRHINEMHRLFVTCRSIPG